LYIFSTINLAEFLQNVVYLTLYAPNTDMVSQHFHNDPGVTSDLYD